jgi:hypothetical protein
MKKLAIIICLLGVVLMCSACGQSFKNIREVDSYLVEQRKKATVEAGFKVKDDSFKRTLNLVSMGLMAPMGAPVTTLDKVMNSLYVPGVVGTAMKNAPKRVKLAKPHGNFVAEVKFNRHEEIRRRPPNQEEYDIIADAFANTRPMSSCAVAKVDIEKVSGSATYKGEDGEVDLAEGFRMRVYFGGKSEDIQPPCSGKDMFIYLNDVMIYLTDRLNTQIEKTSIAVNREQKSPADEKQIGGDQKYKNIGEVDGYLAKQRNEATKAAEYFAWNNNRSASMNSLGSQLLSKILTYSLVPLSSATAPTVLDKVVYDLYAPSITGVVIKNKSTVERIAPPRGVIKGRVKFNRMEEINRKEPNKAELNIIAEAFANTKPMTSCAVAKVDIEEIHESETYKCKDGEVTLGKGFDVVMYYGGKNKDIQPPCFVDDAEKYLKNVMAYSADKVNSRAKNKIAATKSDKVKRNDEIKDMEEDKQTEQIQTD